MTELPPDQRKSTIESEAELRRELPGVLNWMLDGFRDFMARVAAGKGDPLDIDPPEAMHDLKDKLMEDADLIGSFLTACADLKDAGRVPTKGFFRAFFVRHRFSVTLVSS